MIDPASNVAHHIVMGEEGGYILDIAAGEGSGWGIGSNGELASILYRFDSATGAPETHDVGVVASDVAAGGGYIWVVGTGFSEDSSPQSGVGRFDPVTGTTEFFLVGADSETVLYAFDSVWVGDPLGADRAALLRLDPGTGVLIASIPLGDRYAGDLPLYAGAGFLWASTDNGLFAMERSLSGQGPAAALQLSAGSLWRHKGDSGGAGR